MKEEVHGIHPQIKKCKGFLQKSLGLPPFLQMSAVCFLFRNAGETHVKRELKCA